MTYSKFVKHIWTKIQNLLTYNNIKRSVNNETAIVGSSSGGKIVSSQAITLYGIPVIYFVIVALFILFIFYLFCRMKRKVRHSMKKSSYIKLFFALFVPLFLYNLYSMYDGLRFTVSLIFFDPSPFIIIIILTIALSLMESIFPYLFITLSILIINCCRKSAKEEV